MSVDFDDDQTPVHGTAPVASAMADGPQGLRQTLRLFRADLLARATYENKRLTGFQIAKFLLNPAVVATLVYRFQGFFNRPGGRWLASCLRTINSVWMTVDIDSDTRIGGGFFLMHANYICIGPGVRIGRNCAMAHQNSVQPACILEAGRPQQGGAPTLGDDVMLGAGACVSGAITLGDRVQVSVNASVEDSFPDDALLFGVPARMRGRRTSAASED